MSKVYVFTKGSENRKPLLEYPDKRAKSGNALFYCWEETVGFPAEIRELFRRTPEHNLQEMELLLALPKHKVALPGGGAKPQNDIFALGKADGELVSITIEGRVSERFGQTIGEWIKSGSPNKYWRLDYLKKLFGLQGDIAPHIRHQLLHLTASAIIEAKRFNATKAMMIVHSFSWTPEGFEDYANFLQLFGVTAAAGELVSVGKKDGVELYFGWVKGAERYFGK